MAELFQDPANLIVGAKLTQTEYDAVAGALSAPGGDTALINLVASFISQSALVQREQQIQKIKAFADLATDAQRAQVMTVINGG